MSNKNKLTLFDLDGTLFDTKDVNFYSYKEALEEYGLTIDYEYYCKYCNGKKYNTFLPIICGFNDERINKIHASKKKLYSKYLAKARINNELFNLIKQIKNDTYIGLVTTASKKNTMDILSFFKVKSLFDLIITQEEVTKPKPDPEGFIKAIEHFGIDRNNVVIYEDSTEGVEAARKCTDHVVVVTGYR